MRKLLLFVFFVGLLFISKMEGKIVLSDNVILSGIDTIATMSDIREVFPGAIGYLKIKNSTYMVVGTSNKSLGRMVLSTPYSKEIKGFSGQTPLLIALNNDGTIRTVLLLRNRESRHFVNKVRLHGLFSAWNGLSLDQAADKQVDAVSGATYTSTAVIRSMHAAAQANVKAITKSPARVKSEINVKKKANVQTVAPRVVVTDRSSSAEVLSPKEEINHKDVQTLPIGITLSDIRNVFPAAFYIVSKGSAYQVSNVKHASLGFVVLSSPYADKIRGFAGATPLLIALTSDMKVKQVLLLRNHETPKFAQHVRDSGLFSSWNGLGVSDALAKSVDAVSGATYTSTAVINSFRIRMAVLAHEKVSKALPVSIWVKNGLLVLITLFAVLLFFRPRLARKWKLPLLIVSVIVLGFWQSAMLSIAQFVSWLHQGVPLSLQWGLFVVAVLSIALPLFTGKRFYCVYLCPFGALQELVGKVNKKKYIIPYSLVQTLLIVRKTLFVAIIMVIIAGIGFDIGDYEPFSAFNLSEAPIVALIVGCVSICLALFIQKPWCRFVCPLGQGLDLMASKKSFRK
jgi:Na+-translocating ferredoxin:NAD+ oxidoreductase RnfG subunit